MRDLQTDFAIDTVIKLEQNYRSHGNILTCANALIRSSKRAKGSCRARMVSAMRSQRMLSPVILPCGVSMAGEPVSSSVSLVLPSATWKRSSVRTCQTPT
jgi:hypothetical protein